MVSITINNETKQFDCLKDSARYIIEKYDNTACPNCGKKIHGNLDSIYHKLMRNHDAYIGIIYCTSCDNRAKSLGMTFKWLNKLGVKKSKYFPNVNSARNYFDKHPVYCQKCNKKLIMNSRIEHRINYKIADNVYDLGKCLCKDCTAGEQIKQINKNPEFTKKMKTIRANNGRRGAKKLSEKILNNPEELIKRSKRMKAYNDSLTSEQIDKKLKILNKKRKKWVKSDEGKQFLSEHAKNIHAQNKRALTQGLNRYKRDKIIYLYFAEIPEDNNVYKIGITRDMNRRMTLFDSHYKSITSLLEAKPKVICKMEYLIKEKFQLHNYNYGTEYIKRDDLQKVKNYIRYHKNII